MYSNPADRLKEILLRKVLHHDHDALKGVSFEVQSGETLGIIGHNGAGKSTLLKMLSGVLLPDTGTIERGGRITGLLELGTGFNFELSGERNIENNGLLIGMTVEEIAERREAIIAFSELGEFIHEPLKTYSSGMVMRLAFSIAIHAEPDTFLVDEALAVGDAHFQQKCYKRIQEFRERGGSILLVSHDLNSIKMLCDKVLLLDHGQVIEEGDPEQVVNSYNFLVASMGDGNAQLSRKIGATTDYGTGEAELLDVGLLGLDSLANVVSSGERVSCKVRYKINQEIPDLTVGMLVRDRFGRDIFGTNSHLLGYAVPVVPGVWEADFEMDLDIAPGKYTLTAALHSEMNHLDACYHWKDAAANFEVAGVRGPLYSGICRLRPELRIASLGRS
ncbi:ABC transporter ATP-binding protein [Stutzerimonas kunmingensis]|uniref:ABC transporter ATP-binding protein n=1 Tax=Stutzerimonas kunmingensis TaxID=1211807 RepID=UPI0028AF0EB1|nr:ABC transporter ATP-binding protein [Stutzerimonas kunmingensis]